MLRPTSTEVVARIAAHGSLAAKALAPALLIAVITLDLPASFVGRDARYLRGDAETLQNLGIRCVSRALPSKGWQAHRPAHEREGDCGGMGEARSRVA